MKKVVILALLAGVSVLTAAEGVLIKNNGKAWQDRDYIITGLAEEFQSKNPVPPQNCSGYIIKLPKDTKKALIAICTQAGNTSKGVEQVVKKYNLQPCNSDLYIGNASRPRILKYSLYVVENPPAVIECKTTSAGAILLALNDDVPAIKPAAANAQK